ncbi:hypothetical protein DPM19_31080 [Actinomadura craniellae]|uniref:SalK n=2 Tax=Actinomadura craniellae TaxID=2231787 RepID=A0A365GWK8_9ACTN|nr:hypothetical protein DPM19_31080 [Actinomadura craniellae]
MWMLFEPIHAMTYFSPEGLQAYTDAGLRGFWRGYFAGRAAPFGAVDAPVVVASFFGFAPAFVARALPAVWDLITPEQVLRVRAAGAANAIERLAANLGTDLAATADALESVARDLDIAGRSLGAVNAAVPPPDRPAERLWQAATTLREHRGDGHVAALVAAGIDGCESLVLRAGLDSSRRLLQPIRGWTDEQWDAAHARLQARDLITTEGKATPDGTALLQEAEDATDRAAARPWTSLDPAELERVTTLLTPIGDACLAAMPTPNPIGLARAKP